MVYLNKQMKGGNNMAIKVTLLGDSIRLIGYGKYVPEILGDEYEVWQPSDNCRFTEYTMRMLAEEKDHIAGSRIIHWNNGLWDANDLFGDGPFTTEERYAENLERIARLLLQRCDRLIFATTTPVRHDTPNHTIERVKRYNEIAVDVLTKQGVTINDLFSLLEPDIYRYIRDDDKIHLTYEAAKLCAEQVAEKIREQAEFLK